MDNIATLLFFYSAIVVGCGTAGLLSTRNDSRFTGIITTIISAASLLTLFFILFVYRPIDTAPPSQLIAWQLPFANMVAGCDSLSAFFLIPLLILAACSAVYGPRYMKEHAAGRTHWFFFSLLIIGMVVVLCARNGVQFILAWEIMSLASFFLVISDSNNEESIRAGWIYFVTAHIGTAFLFALFFLLSSSANSFDFSAWKALEFHGRTADAIFILALFGFGLKAGFIPFHVWLPLAHPAAPSHVSALMSGIMIKMGIYGILRMLTFIAPFHAWWGMLLIAIGSVSGVLGVLFAIGQHDIKRLLAYHSVENIGIILLGIGLGVVGIAYGSGTIALFGFAGGLLHVINHSLFKAILFLGAGAVIRQNGTGTIDRLGGLIKTMPRTAPVFLIGAIAICGLPFFNGFISEIMIYAGSINGAALSSQPALALFCLAVILSLALIGGLASACFTKVFGIIFLGEPRNAQAKAAGDVPFTMLGSMWVLAALCIVIGLASPLVLPYLIRPVLLFVPAGISAGATSIDTFTTKISIVLAAAGVIMLFVALVNTFLVRKNRSVASTVTWDCGYAKPDASMQYTASSFADPIVGFFKRPLAAHQKLNNNTACFPREPWSFHASVDDWFLSKIYSPATEYTNRFFSLLRWFQSGKSGEYVLYIALTVLGLILWKFFL
jgi:hydrogenase-4 component B